MKITEIKLYTTKSGDTGARGTAMQWMGGITPGRWVAAMAKPYDMPVIPHGASVYNYHFMMANTNSPYAEYLSVGTGTDIQPIFSVELKRSLLAPLQRLN